MQSDSDAFAEAVFRKFRDSSVDMLNATKTSCLASHPLNPTAAFGDKATEETP